MTTTRINRTTDIDRFDRDGWCAIIQHANDAPARRTIITQGDAPKIIDVLKNMTQNNRIACIQKYANERGFALAIPQTDGTGTTGFKDCTPEAQSHRLDRAIETIDEFTQFDMFRMDKQ